MFIWRNLSPGRIVECIEYLYPGAAREALEDGGAGDAAPAATHGETPASLARPGITPPKA